ncbi:MAG: DUF3482 domain-containing protein [Candidatus Wenzhouxiangella sp. M2_3B_020]
MNRRDPELLTLAVVGHTNVGKTSLMRTLMRDATFGDIAPTSATTRRIEGARLLADGRPVVELFDTPGLEDAGALIEWLDAEPSRRHSGPERVAAFMESELAAGRFEQEARVLEQAIGSDAMLYVVDAREPVLGKYQDELAILALTARPILPVLNFVTDRAGRPRQWREALARVGLHAVSEFDTVVFSLESEVSLWQRLATLLEKHGPALESLVSDRDAQARWQIATGHSMIAELLVDAAAARRSARRDDPDEIAQAERSLREVVTEREQRFVDEAMRLFRFSESDYRTVPLPFEGGGWRESPFDARTLALVAPATGGGAAAGAAAGAAVDLATMGLSLGAGTLIGALTGGGAGAAWQLRRRLSERLRGRIGVRVDDAALTTIAARAFALLDALRQRGHAAQKPIEIADALPSPWPDDGRLPGPLLRARLAPGISTLNRGADADVARRHALSAQLAERLSRSDRSD